MSTRPSVICSPCVSLANNRCTLRGSLWRHAHLCVGQCRRGVAGLDFVGERPRHRGLGRRAGPGLLGKPVGVFRCHVFGGQNRPAATCPRGDLAGRTAGGLARLASASPWPFLSADWPLPIRNCWPLPRWAFWAPPLRQPSRAWSYGFANAKRLGCSGLNPSHSPIKKPERAGALRLFFFSRSNPVLTRGAAPQSGPAAPPGALENSQTPRQSRPKTRTTAH